MDTKFIQARMTVVEMLIQRGYVVPPSYHHKPEGFCSDFMEMQCNPKNRSTVMDLHVANTDAHAYVGWCPSCIKEDKKNPGKTRFDSDAFKRNIVDMITCFRADGGSYNISDRDDLIVILMDDKPLTEKHYQYENESITIFSLATLCRNITRHRFVPRHSVMDHLSAKKLYHRLGIKKGQLPTLQRFMRATGPADPIARFYGMRIGDTVKIIRNSPTSGTHYVYREVVGEYTSGALFLGKEAEKPLETLTKGIRQIVQKDIPEWTSDLGETTYIGPNVNTSYGGHSMSVLLSAIQKFVRRSYRASEESKEGDYQTGREQKLALWVGSEIESIACLYWNVLQIKRNIDKNPTIQWSTFTEAEQETLRRVMNREDYQSQVSDHTFSKPKKTWRTCIDTICTTLQAGLRKFIHRLMIISVEEVFAPWVAETLTPLFIEAYGFHATFLETISAIIWYLCSAPRVRLVSDTISAYQLPMEGKDRDMKTFSDVLDSVDDIDKPKHELLTNIDSVGMETLHRFSKYYRDIPFVWSHDEHVEESLRETWQANRDCHTLFIQTHTDLYQAVCQPIPDSEYQSDVLHFLVALDQPELHQGESEPRDRYSTVFYWLRKLLLNPKGPKKVLKDDCPQTSTGKGMSRKCAYFVWDILLKYTDKCHPHLKEMILKLRSWFHDINLGISRPDQHGERLLFLYNAIHQILHYPSSSTSFPDPPDNLSQLPAIEEIRQYRVKPIEPSLPGYVFDQHVPQQAKKINQRISELHSQLQAIRGQDPTEDPVRNLLDKPSGCSTWLAWLTKNSSQSDRLERIVAERPLHFIKVQNYLLDEFRNHRHFAMVSSRIPDEEQGLVVNAYRLLFQVLREGHTEGTIVGVKEAVPRRPATRTGPSPEVGPSPGVAPSPEVRQEEKKEECPLVASVATLCNHLATTKKQPAEITENRSKIYRTINEKFHGLTLNKPADFDQFDNVIVDRKTVLQTLLHQYDKLFFSGELLRLSGEHGCEYTICWNKKCTATAGFCKPDAACKHMIIELAPTVFKDALEQMDNKGGTGITQGGLACNDPLSCIQLTFEHELIHALINCFCTADGRRNGDIGTWTKLTAPRSGHSKMFMSILNNTFGHTQYRHDLFRTVEESSRSKKDFGVGLQVTFTSKEGAVITGSIEKLNLKKAVIRELIDGTPGGQWKVPYSGLTKKEPT